MQEYHKITAPSFTPEIQFQIIFNTLHVKIIGKKIFPKIHENIHVACQETHNLLEVLQFYASKGCIQSDFIQ